MSVVHTFIICFTLFLFSLHRYCKFKCSSLRGCLFYIGRKIYCNVVNVGKSILNFLYLVSFSTNIGPEKYNNSSKNGI
jgi:hypothetical protein